MKALLAAAVIAAALSGCNKPPVPQEAARPVRAVRVDRAAPGEVVSLTGQVRAKDQVNAAFRIDGRLIERPVNVGDPVRPGQLLARLDLQNQVNGLRSAEANVAAAEAARTQAQLTFGRQQALVQDGWTPRAKFDEAKQALLTAEAQLSSARAQLRTAQDQLGYTVLRAEAPGVVTAIGAEPGEVVRTGSMIVRIALDGPRDAVFDVPEQLMQTSPRDPQVEIALTTDPSVRAVGRVREVSPQADADTRTFQVKVAITDPPAAMRLGATVTGRIVLPAPPGHQLPATALIEANGKPAVWVVDPHSLTVLLRNVEIVRYDPASVIVSQGLQPGDRVVEAGVQTLRPGQKVQLLGGEG